jgi:hypothetical protein
MPFCDPSANAASIAVFHQALLWAFGNWKAGFQGSKHIASRRDAPATQRSRSAALLTAHAPGFACGRPATGLPIPLLAPNGPTGSLRRCPLFGVDRKWLWLAEGQTDAIDPTATWRFCLGVLYRRFMLNGNKCYDRTASPCVASGLGVPCGVENESGLRCRSRQRDGLRTCRALGWSADIVLRSDAHVATGRANPILERRGRAALRFQAGRSGRT